MRKKILILTPFYPPNIGGVETFCKNLEKELDKKYDTEICTINWGRQKNFKGTGIPQFLDIFPRLLLRFIIQLEESKFDLVHAQGFNAALLGMLFKKAYRYELFVTTHAFYNFRNRGSLFRYIARKILNNADKIFIEGENVKQDILTLGISEKKLNFYCHWCNQDIFKPIQHESKELVVLCAGRLDIKEKGLSIIKRIEKQLQGKEIKFIYAKNVPHQDMPKYYQMADVVIVPSVYNETFPIVVIEAASCGCAIMTTNNGSLPELIKDFGIVVKGNINFSWEYVINFEEKLLYYYDNREALKVIQQKSFEYAREHFSPKNAEVFL